MFHDYFFPMIPYEKVCHSPRAITCVVGGYTRYIHKNGLPVSKKTGKKYSLTKEELKVLYGWLSREYGFFNGL